MKMIVDGSELILGRMASEVAQKLLKGERVVIVNAEKVVLTGRKEDVYARFKKRCDLANKGNPHIGPKFSRMPDRLVRMTVRGMLPFKRKPGKEAFKRLQVFISVPEEFKAVKSESIEAAKVKSERFISVGEVSKLLGASW